MKPNTDTPPPLFWQRHRQGANTGAGAAGVTLAPAPAMPDSGTGRNTVDGTDRSGTGRNTADWRIYWKRE